ncbi:MAG: MotA/TolQ/ExbB proton channel family protein [Parvibaculaceae bacterium]|nr:MotA/TolQ/ExbB proton channel family protein [Parvibaculaceae bacterium]
MLTPVTRILAAAAVSAFMFASPVMADDAPPAQPAATAETPSTDQPASAATAAPDAAQAAPAAVEGPLASSETQTVANPYGLGALWGQGDFVAKATLLILLIMSIGSWYILITKFIEQRTFLKEGRKLHKDFAAGASLAGEAGKLHERGAYRAIADGALDAVAEHRDGLSTQISLPEWASVSIQRNVDASVGRLQAGLAFLATVGSTAPFVGLFGTVWGIYHALVAIGLSGQASIDKVAGPVGEALIMTAIGLAVAVPAVLSYNWLVRRNKSIIEGFRRFGNDVLTRVLREASVADQGASVRPAPHFAEVAAKR